MTACNHNDIDVTSALLVTFQNHFIEKLKSLDIPVHNNVTHIIILPFVTVFNKNYT